MPQTVLRRFFCCKNTRATSEKKWCGEKHMCQKWRCRPIMKIGLIPLIFFICAILSPSQAWNNQKDRKKAEHPCYLQGCPIIPRRYAISIDDVIIWRSGWDSNPRALADNLISSQGRYSHFDTAPYINFYSRPSIFGETLGRETLLSAPSITPGAIDFTGFFAFYVFSNISKFPKLSLKNPYFSYTLSKHVFVLLYFTQ